MNGTELLDWLRDAAALYGAFPLETEAQPVRVCTFSFCAASRMAADAVKRAAVSPAQHSLAQRLEALCAQTDGNFAHAQVYALLLPEDAADDVCTALRRAWHDRYGAAEGR